MANKRKLIDIARDLREGLAFKPEDEIVNAILFLLDQFIEQRKVKDAH